MSHNKIALQSSLNKVQLTPKTTVGYIGDNNGNVFVPGRANYIYIRIPGPGGMVSQVYDINVPPSLDLPVLVGYDPKEPHVYQVLSVSKTAGKFGGGSSTSTFSVPPHHLTHEWMADGGGSDVVFINQRQFLPLMPYTTQNMTLNVYRGFGYLNSTWTGITGQSMDLTSFIPVTGALLGLAYIDTGGVLQFTPGTLKSIATLGITDIPTPTAGTIPIAAIRLYAGQAQIYEVHGNTDITDLRFAFNNSVGGGGSTGTVSTGSVGGGGVAQQIGVWTAGNTIGGFTDLVFMHETGSNHKPLGFIGQSPSPVSSETMAGTAFQIENEGDDYSVFRLIEHGLGAPLWAFWYSRGTKIAPTAVQANDYIGYTAYEGYDGYNWHDVGRMALLADENFTTGTHGTRFWFQTTRDGTYLNSDTYEFRNGNINIGGSFVGDGSQLTNLPGGSGGIQGTGTTNQLTIWNSGSLVGYPNVFIDSTYNLYQRVAGLLPQHLLQRSGGSTSIPTGVLSGDVLGRFSWQGYGATGWGNNVADISATALENFTDSAKGSKITFRTNTTGSISLGSSMTFDGRNSSLSIGTGTYQGDGRLLTNLPVRTILLADQTYYVSTVGNDSNTGLTTGSSFLTIQHAINVSAALDTSIYNVTIKVADGAYAPGTIFCYNLIGSGTVTITGNAVTPTNVSIDGGFQKSSAGTTYYINNLQVHKAVSSAAYGIVAILGAVIYYSGVDFGSGLSYHIGSLLGGDVECNGNYTISGGANCHIYNFDATVEVVTKTITISGNPNFSSAFVYSDRLGMVSINGNTFTGSATGIRFYVGNGSVIYTANAGLTYLPGDTVGIFANDGKYDNYVSSASGVMAIGPGTSVANHVATFSGTDGQTLADGGVLRGASYQATPGDPTGATNTTGTMMGLAGAITPVRTGIVLIQISGTIANATAIADGGKVQIRYGTGTVPSNGNTLMGTAVGGQVNYVTATTAEKAPFSLNAVVSGLTLGTAIWIDLALAAVTGGTATVKNISISAIET